MTMSNVKGVGDRLVHIELSPISASSPQLYRVLASLSSLFWLYCFDSLSLLSSNWFKTCCVLPAQHQKLATRW